MTPTAQPLRIDLGFVGLEVWLGLGSLVLAAWLRLPFLGLLTLDAGTGIGLDCNRIPPDVLDDMDAEAERLDSAGREPWSAEQGEALLLGLLQRAPGKA